MPYGQVTHKPSGKPIRSGRGGRVRTSNPSVSRPPNYAPPPRPAPQPVAHPLAHASSTLARMIQNAQAYAARPPSSLRGSTNLLGITSPTDQAQTYAATLEDFARKIQAQTDRVVRKASKLQREGKATAPTGPLGTPQSLRIGPRILPEGFGPDRADAQKAKQARGAHHARVIHAGRATVDQLRSQAQEARHPDTSTVNALLDAAAGVPVGGAEAVGAEKLLGAVGPKLARTFGGTAARGVGRILGRGAEAVAEHSPEAAKVVARGVARGWRSTPVGVARTAARGASAPVRIPMRYAGRHPYQSFGASNAAVGAIAAASSGDPRELYQAPARFAATTARTTFEHPGDVALTTGRIVPSMATAIAALPADVGAAVLHGNTDPLKGLGESQIEYLKQIQDVAQGKDYTYTDPVTHKKVTLTPEQLIQHNLGLVPAIGGGLLAYKGLRGHGLGGKAVGAADAAANAIPRVGRPISREARVRKIIDTMQHGATRDERIAAEKKLAGMKAPMRARMAERRREAQRAAATGERIGAQFDREMTVRSRGVVPGVERGSRHGAPNVRLDAQLSALHHQRLDGEVSVGDVAQLIGRHGWVTAEQAIRGIENLKNRLEKPTRELDRNALNTRDVVEAASRHPEVVADPGLREFLGAAIGGEGHTGWAKMARERSIERHTERTGTRQTTPDPEDLRARDMHQARELGIPLENERVPHELRGVSEHKVEAGVDAETAIRGEARAARQRAKKAGEKARAQKARTRGHLRELSVRRVADDRRSAVRSLDKGLRTLQKRRDAWQKRLDDLKKPANEPLHQAGGEPAGTALEQAQRKAIRAADEGPMGRRTQQREAAERKVADLDRQIKERKARLTLSASPARLRAVKRASESERARRGLEAQAKRERARASQLEAVVNRKRRAEGLERQALKEEGAGNAKGAATLRKQAQTLRRQDLASQAKLRDEFSGEIGPARAEAGLAEPIYFKESDVADRGSLNVLAQYPSGRLPKKEQRRIGTLAAQGRIDEGAATLLENAYRERVAMEMRVHARSMLDELPFKTEDGRMVFTGPEQRKLFRDGEIPPGYKPYALQELNRVLQRGAWDEAAGLRHNELMRQIREARGKEGSKFVLVPEAGLKEFKDQFEAWNSGLKHIRTLARLQSLGMLALSPAWFAFQLIASPLAAIVAHPNPVAWGKAMKESLDLWRNTPAESRIRFQSQYGGTSADAIAAHQYRLGMEPGTVRDMSEAAGVAIRSPVARIGHAIAEQIKGGGPLIRGNRLYETKIRDLVALIESDKQIKNAEKVIRADGNIMVLHDVVTRHLAELKDATMEERIHFYDTHPAAQKELVDAVNDTLGDWNSLSSHERGAAAFTVFYPFLRFSLRWLFVSMPRNHPFTTAVLAQLSQRNAQEIQTMLGGAPSFFPDWGNVVVHDGPNGEPQTALDLGRAAPGSNAILEALGQGGFNLGTLTAPFQPVIKTALTAAAGQDPLTGRVSRLSKGELLLKGILGLSPPLRPIAHRVGGVSPYSQLFAAITGHEGTPGEYLAPNPLTSLAKEREARRLSHLMNIAFGDSGPESTAAKAEIDKLFQKYGINHSASGSTSSGGSSSAVGGGGWSSGGSSSVSTSGGWAQ